MQLNTRQIVINNQNFWAVTIDGVVESHEAIKGFCEAGPTLYSSIQGAFSRMDELWANRPQADRTMEALYVGRD